MEKTKKGEIKDKKRRDLAETWKKGERRGGGGEKGRWREKEGAVEGKRRQGQGGEKRKRRERREKEDIPVKEEEETNKKYKERH